jgi:hypothetical protein
MPGPELAVRLDHVERTWQLAPMRKRSGILDHIPGAPRLGKVIVDLDTGEITPLPVPEGGWANKDVAAVSLGRRGGRKGGRARAESLTAEQRSEIARLAARTRWGRKSETDV